jgi:hypothetical protein
MTILVGILCKDGAVIASDGMASQNLGTTPFVATNNLKTHIIDEKLIVACAGEDNYMTLFVSFLQSNYASLSKKHEESGADVQALMNELGAKFAHRVIEIFKTYPPELTQNFFTTIQNGMAFQAIVALPFNNKHYVFHYDGKLAATMLRDNGLWHTILGSGFLIGTPSIHLVKKILKISSSPTVNRGLVLAYWTVNHAIEVSSGGIGGDITTAVLRKVEGQYKAAIENRVSEHKEIIDDIYKHIWSYESGKAQDEQVKKIPDL